MRERKRSPDNPAEWIKRAGSSLTLSTAKTPGVLYEDLCFQAQQAVEKALKALLLARGARPPYTHDLATLLRLVEKSGETVPQGIERVVRLTDYAVETRYPGLFEPVTQAELREAQSLASRCVAWVRGKIA